MKILFEFILLSDDVLFMLIIDDFVCKRCMSGRGVRRVGVP